MEHLIDILQLTTQEIDDMVAMAGGRFGKNTGGKISAAAVP